MFFNMEKEKQKTMKRAENTNFSCRNLVLFVYCFKDGILFSFLYKLPDCLPAVSFFQYGIRILSSLHCFERLAFKIFVIY